MDGVILLYLAKHGQLSKPKPICLSPNVREYSDEILYILTSGTQYVMNCSFFNPAKCTIHYSVLKYNYDKKCLCSYVNQFYSLTSTSNDYLPLANPVW